MPPLTVRLAPASTPRVVSADKVREPPNMLEPSTERTAPPEATPDPASTSAWLKAKPPWSSSAACVCTDTALEPEPKAEAVLRLRIPALTLVAPV